MKKNFNEIEEVITALADGKMIVLLDDEQRENEGDIIMVAEKMNAAAINFMTKHARGLICLAMMKEKCRRLKLPLMVPSTHNASTHCTNFTVSIDAKEGISTGISAADRAHTIKTAAASRTTAKELVRPGHIFPLMAHTGGVLSRAGHTEAATDLASLAGCQPAASLVEIMNPDGSMARAPQLYGFARKHQLKISTIAALVAFRLRKENLLHKSSQRQKLATLGGTFRTNLYRDKIAGTKYLALSKKSKNKGHAALVHIARLNIARDLLGQEGTRHNLNEIMEEINQQGGVLLIVDAERISVEYFIKNKERKEELSLRHIALCARILRDLNMMLINPLHIPISVVKELSACGIKT